MKYFWRLFPLSFILLMSGCGMQNLSALDPQGPVAEGQFSLIMLSLYIMIFVIVVVFVLYVIVLLRFRERPGDTHIPKQVHGNRGLEFVWTIIPIILLIILAVPNVMQTFTLADMEPGEDEEVVNVRVTGHQFWWEFEYPDYGITAGQDLYIPTDTRIMFELEASDVIHAFWVPALAGKQDNVPGITNYLWFEAPNEGVYRGKCAELCGEGHAWMDFRVIAVDPDTFDTWVQNMEEPPAHVTEPQSEVAVEGRQVFEQNCISCHAVGEEGGNLGPNLTNYGERDVLAGFLDPNDENLEDWLRYPQELKPGNEMPGFDHLADDEMNALIEYLNDLKVLED
ncbi:cytochrome c oxidase subunit II [Bacillus shivajii]|uniref:cytochrome c oxidase subunit II n=1 Tax=Bacillus shivajii TaxID=1983719 RepID=UPI001CFA00FD|nr:cytochrome c oxidase subunit II [Bacillus shivajii]UCZ51862.1 cytochrome c oxidase subunit II [Bacillus shivajii]